MRVKFSLPPQALALVSALALAVLPVLGGCSDPEGTSDTGGDIVITPEVDNGGSGDGTSGDGTSGDGTSGDSTEDGAGPGDGGDTNLTDGPSVDATTEPDNTPLNNDAINWDIEIPPPTGGAPGAPCTEPDDCNSGWCVASAEGRVCTKSCIENCPFPGWQCSGVTDSQGNPSFICLDQTVNLCNPCSQNKDCNSGATNAPNLCLNRGAEGNFCGMNCGQGGTSCPPGYECADVESGSSVSTFQCIPQDAGQCDCNGWGVEEGVSTTCDIVVDGVGTCPGTRQCETDGLTLCAGEVPQPETCNGLDDNCDGNVDEGVVGGSCDLTNNFGTCPGTLACGGNAEEVCVGNMPTGEVCNGVDDDCDGVVDNGEPDFDEDGIADCVDTDDDNDGTLDSDDCKPYDADIGLLATETCDGVDNNCNGLIDEEGATGCSNWWQDADGDTYGSAAAGPKCLCAADAGQFYTVLNDTDCNDLAPSAFPGGTEVCNAIDDDCNGQVDDGLAENPPSCFISNSIGTCQGQQLCVAGSTTCVGTTPSVEICNELDDDCNGAVDDGTPDYDDDGMPNCTDPDDDNDGSLDGDDCQPLNEVAYPGANENCDGTDTDCNGVIDDENAVGCMAFFQDADDDGYGSDQVASKCLCGPDDFTYFNTTDQGDCNDIANSVNPARNETCNYVDDDCNGDIDEGVSSPCGDCSSVCVIDTGEEGDDGDFDPTDDNSTGVATDPDGGITLDSSVAEIPFIWIANTAGDTASKLNTETGAEVGRYRVCDSPSRTAVDVNGNGIITARHGACVVKIAVFEADCIDGANNAGTTNGVIDTSRDINGNGIIDNAEILPLGDDECILWNVTPDGSSGDCDAADTVGCGRAAGVDADGDVWVGFWNSSRLYELDGLTGTTKTIHQLTNRPYGLAIDGDQNIWVASRNNSSITLVDSNLGQVDTWAPPDGTPYGLALDPFGGVWVATSSAGGVQRFDPSGNNGLGSFTYGSGDLGRGYGRGMAVSVKRDSEGEVIESKVYVGHHSWDNGGCNDATSRMISVFNIDPVTKAVTQGTPISLGTTTRGPVGVALDSENNLWTVNQCTSTATKIDTDTQVITGEYPVGLGPYTYSDMSGYALKTITAPSGYYRQIYNGWPGSITLWDKVIVDATLPGNGITRLEIRYRTADTEVELSSAAWVGPFGPYPPDTFPLDVGVNGNVFELEIRLITDDPAFKPTVHDISVIAYENPDA